MPNVVYVWVARGEVAQTIINTHAPDKLLVKVGVTTQRLGAKRVNSVARQYRFHPELRCLEFRTNAQLIERALLRIGAKASGLAGDGHTEFRFMSEHELQTALSIVGTSSVQQEARSTGGTWREERLRNAKDVSWQRVAKREEVDDNELERKYSKLETAVAFVVIVPIVYLVMMFFK